jgi:lambda repressor-like predicted transcriptional regulator
LAAAPRKPLGFVKILRHLIRRLDVQIRSLELPLGSQVRALPGHRSKSRSVRFDGYKRHIVRDLDTGLVPAVGISPADAPEASVTDDIAADLATAGWHLNELHIDRAYLSSTLVRERGEDLAVFCKAWRVRNATGRSGRYLSLLERQRIATLRRQGLGVRAIARELGRAAWTVSRELHRNHARHDRAYDGDLAHDRARQWARRPRSGRLLADAQLRQLVQAKLELEWSLEQIVAWLPRSYPDRPSWHLCHETIYRAPFAIANHETTATRPHHRRARRPRAQSTLSNRRTAGADISA